MLYNDAPLMAFALPQQCPATNAAANTNAP
jgi:hypothetical protein